MRREEKGRGGMRKEERRGEEEEGEREGEEREGSRGKGRRGREREGEEKGRNEEGGGEEGRGGTGLGLYFLLYSRFTSRLVSPALQKAELKTISNSNSTIGNMEVGVACVPN